MPTTSRSGDVREVAFGDGAQRLALEVEDGPARWPARPGPAAGHLQDLPEVEVAVDALERAGAGALEPAEETVQRFFVRPDGAGRPGPRTDGRARPLPARCPGPARIRRRCPAPRRAGGARWPSPRPARGLRRRTRSPGWPRPRRAARHRVRRRGIRAPQRVRRGRGRGRPDRVRPGCGRGHLPLAGHPAKGCRHLRGAPGGQRRADFHLGVLALGEHPEELHDGDCAAVVVVDDHRTVRLLAARAP